MRRRICVLVLSAWRKIVIFGGHVFSRGMDMLYLVLIFSSFLGGKWWRIDNNISPLLGGYGARTRGVF